MPLLLPRQATPSGARTVSVNAGGTALSIDSANTGTESGLVPPTLTVSSTDAPTTSTLFAVPTSSPSVNSSSSSRGSVNTSAIIGIIVGIFVVLAATLIAFMTIRHRKQKIGTMRARALSSARKSWTRLQEDRREPPAAEMQMRETNLAKTATIAVDTNAHIGHDSFSSLNSPRALVLNDKAASPLGNPTQQSSGLGRTFTPSQAPQPTKHSADESHIPNPFTSPTTSPSPSRSPSHTSTYSTQTSSPSPNAASSFVQHTPQYAYAHAHAYNASMVTASSARTDKAPGPPEATPPPPKAAAILPGAPKSARLVRKSSSRPVDDPRTRELKAMQDLISALDGRTQSKKEAAPPSAFHLTIDTNTTRGSSRLSMGEGLVTPGGHSIQEEDAVMKFDRDGNPYWADAQRSAFEDDDEQESFSLPSAQVFRAALGSSDVQGKEDKSKKAKGKGKKTPDPFRD